MIMIKVVFNPESGKSKYRPLIERIMKELSGLSVDLEYTYGPGHATDIARSAARNGADTVIAIGGDGTVNEVLNGLTGTKASLGIIPAGTANDLARHLGIPRNLTASCNLIRSSFTTILDTIEVNGRRFLTAGGVGFACDVAQKAKRLKRESLRKIAVRNLLGGKLYVIAALLAIATRKHVVQPVEILTGGRSVIFDPLWIMISNQPRVGRFFLMSPEAENDDGYFDVCMTKNTRSRLKILSTTIRVIAGTHEKLPDVSAFRAEVMTIRTSRPMPFFGDGELLCESSEFKLRVIPASIRVLVPSARVDTIHDQLSAARTLIRPALEIRS